MPGIRRQRHGRGFIYTDPDGRVIRETGVVGEYRWGAVRKRAIIAWESGLRNGTPGTAHTTAVEVATAH